MRNRAAELVVAARRCYLAYPYRRWVEALLVRDGRVVAGGTRRAVRGLTRRSTRVLALGRDVVTPGFVDSHTHFFYWALGRALVVDVSNARSLAAALSQIKQGAKRRAVGDWVVARGFDQNYSGGAFPTAADLDAVIRDRPVMVRSRDGHAAWLNSAGLARASITAKSRDPQGGRYLRDARGRPSGVALETAVDLLPNPVAEFALSREAAASKQVDAALDSAYRASWSLGITGVHALDDAPSLSHLQRHQAERRLGLRIVHSIPIHRLNELSALGLRSGIGDDWLRLGAVKIFADGTLGSQTALMFDEYPGRRGYYGVPVTAGAALHDAVIAAAKAGWASWVHAIGDRAAHDAIAAMAAARKTATLPMPHRVEHAQCVRSGDIRAMARHGIIASVQPCHLLTDITNADRHWPQARRDAYALRRMLDAGVTLAMGSDVPVESIDPRRSLHAAVTRTDESGAPPGGWFADQQLTIAEVIRGFTEHAHASIGRARPWGTLLPGAPADATVWADDPLLAHPQELLSLKIAGCIVDGEARL